MFPESNFTRDLENNDDKMEIDQINSKCAKKSPSAIAAKGPDQTSPPGKGNEEFDVQLNKLTLDDKRPSYKPVVEPAIQRKLRHQIEYYFGNSNLAQDKHLVDLLKKDTHDSPYNCVKIIDILKFKRV